MSTPDLNPSAEPAPRNHTRRNTAIGVTAGLLGGGVVGLLMAVPSLTSAASDDSTADTSASTVAAVVADDSATSGTDTAISPTSPAGDEQADPGARMREMLQPLVDDGTITSAQADSVAKYLAEHRPEGGRGGDHGPGGRPGGRGPGFDGQVVADLLGIDADTLRSELRDGSTIAAIAEAQGVDVQTVIDALVAEAKEHLDTAVTDGRLTQDEADAKLADITEKITDHVNNGRPQGAPEAPPADAPADASAESGS